MASGISSDSSSPSSPRLRFTGVTLGVELGVKRGEGALVSRAKDTRWTSLVGCLCGTSDALGTGAEVVITLLEELEEA